MKRDKLTATPARKDETLEAVLPDSLIVYDMVTSQGHDLQPIAALVWKSCNGRTSVTEIARLVGDSFPVESAEDVVLYILDQFKDKSLLKETSDQPEFFSPVSRREVIRKYIPAAMVLPFILTSSAPTTAQLVSGGPRPCVPERGPETRCTRR